MSSQKQLSFLALGRLSRAKSLTHLQPDTKFAEKVSFFAGFGGGRPSRHLSPFFLSDFGQRGEGLSVIPTVYKFKIVNAMGYRYFSFQKMLFFFLSKKHWKFEDMLFFGEGYIQAHYKQARETKIRSTILSSSLIQANF